MYIIEHLLYNTRWAMHQYVDSDPVLSDFGAWDEQQGRSPQGNFVNHGVGHRRGY